MAALVCWQLDSRWGWRRRGRWSPQVRALVGCAAIPGAVVVAAAVAGIAGLVHAERMPFAPVGAGMVGGTLLGGRFFGLGLLRSVQDDLVAQWRARHPRRKGSRGVRRKGRR